MDTVFISGLKASSVIGCYDWERDIRQTLVIDLELKADFARAAETDALADALDYAAISNRVIALCDESRFQLLEALAETGNTEPIDVELGEGTLDEMCLAGVGVAYRASP